MLRVIGGIVHGPEHAPCDRESTASVVTDLDREDLRTRSHTVESLPAEHVVTGRDACDVTSMCGVVEEQIQHGTAVDLAEVHRDSHQTLVPLLVLESITEPLGGDTVIVYGCFVIQPAVVVHVGNQRPAAHGSNHEHDELIGVVVVAVEIGGGNLP